jgi:hypothetical protein
MDTAEQPCSGSPGVEKDARWMRDVFRRVRESGAKVSV